MCVFILKLESFAASLLCLARYSVRLCCSPRCWPCQAVNPSQIIWNSHVAFPLSWGRWPSLTKQNCSCARRTRDCMSCMHHSMISSCSISQIHSQPCICIRINNVRSYSLNICLCVCLRLRVCACVYKQTDSFGDELALIGLTVWDNDTEESIIFDNFMYKYVHMWYVFQFQSCLCVCVSVWACVCACVWALFLSSNVSALHRNAHIWNASHPLLVTYHC